MPACKNVATFLFCAAAPALGARRHTFTSLRADLQPEVVALTLSKVEQDWRGEAGSFVRCNSENGTDCSAPVHRFQNSCATVVEAVLQASGGERGVVQDYLGEVCSQGTLDGWRGEACQKLSTSLLNSMSTIASANREDMNVVTPCESFWASLINTEKTNMEKELAEEAAEEKRRKQEEEKISQEEATAAKERAAAKKKREEEEQKQREAQAAQAAKEAKEAEAEASKTQAILKSAQQVADGAQAAESSASDQLGAAKTAVESVVKAEIGNATSANITSNATRATNVTSSNHSK